MTVRLNRVMAAATALSLTVLPAVATASVTAAAPPRAQQADQQALVLIESVTPAVPGPKSKLVIQGRVANNTGDAVDSPAVQLRLSPEPLTSRSEIREVLRGSTLRQGIPVPGTQRDLGQRLEPGQQAGFRIRLPISSLELGPGAGVYAFMVESSSGGVPVGRAGTVVPWFPPKAHYEPTGLALMWPVEQLPDVAADELVMAPQLPEDFGPDGRLTRLVSAGSGHDVAWMVDAATVTTAAGMSDGYRILGPDGPQPGDRTDDAKAFLAQLSTALSQKAVTLPGYAAADADALQRAGLVSLVVRSVSLPGGTASEYLPGATATTAYVPASGRVDDDTMRALADAGVRTFVLSDRAFPPDPPLNYTPTGATAVDISASTVRVLLADSPLSRTLAAPTQTAAERSSASQRFLAETAMITLERPNEPRQVVGMPPALWDPPPGWTADLVAALEKAPWVRLIPLSRVGLSGQVPRFKSPYRQAQRKSELPSRYMSRLRSLEQRLASLTAIVDDASGFGETFTLALQRAASALWRDRPESRQQLVATISRQLREEKAKVRVVSSGTVTLSGDSGVLPLTIANDLDRTVTVGIRLRTANQVRLQYGQPKPLTIRAKQKAGIELPVRIVGSQPMEVAIVLTDRDGNVYDANATLELRSTAASSIAAAVAILAGVALLILVGIRFWRRAHG
ncbi:MAG: DUF6049 family protein [Candidatus Nanopelagicales bacterium]|nr:DUF6049 family protein [Candidatus Nanopelagicales bacterium]